MSTYDANLLASAPKATKAQLQDGYNSDLLTEKALSTPTSAAAAIDPEVVNHPLTSVQRDESTPVFPLTKKNTPFYRTRKGIIVIVVLVVIVIIAAVVGGAVGGTRNKKSTITKGPASGTGSGATSSNMSTITGGQSSAPIYSGAGRDTTSAATPANTNTGISVSITTITLSASTIFGPSTITIAGAPNSIIFVPTTTIAIPSATITSTFTVNGSDGIGRQMT